MVEEKIEIIDIYELGEVLAVKYKFTFENGKVLESQANFHLGETQDTIQRVLSQMFKRRKNEYSDVGVSDRDTVKQTLKGMEFTPL